MCEFERSPCNERRLTDTTSASRRRDVAFASPYPGKIHAVRLKEWGGTVIAQKDAFLCAARGVDIDIAFHRFVEGLKEDFGL